MNRILRLYVIREVVLSTLLTLFTIVFMMLMNQVARLMVIMLQPSVKVSQVLGALGGFIPQLMVLAIPMAILIGVLIGVGRMTLDREMLACKASGINLFSIFLPMILLGGIVSLALMGLSSKTIPRLFASGLKTVSEMQFAMITSLEPGRFHDSSDMGGGSLMGGGDLEFFFRSRDPKDPNIMKGIMLKLGEESDAAKREKGSRAKAAKALEEAQAAEGVPGAATAGKPSHAALENILSTATQRKVVALPANSAGTDSKAAAEQTKEKKGTKSKDEPTSLSVRRNQLTLVTAESGVVSYSNSEKEENNKDIEQRQMVLKLTNGTIHQLNPDSANHQYMVIRYIGLEKKLFTNSEIPKVHKTMTNQELRKVINDKTAKKDLRRAARRELTQRFSISLASFVFVLIGIPLAIWVRPSGKSWGILMAVGLMLVYYLLMQWGLGMVEYGRPMGTLVAFSPNLLFVALGAVLWRHAVKS